MFPDKIIVTYQENEESEPETFDLVRNGTGLCEWGLFRIDLYRAGLYPEETSKCGREIIDANEVKHIRLHFARRFTRKQMRRAYVGSVPPTKELKEGLLGLSEDD